MTSAEKNRRHASKKRGLGPIKAGVVLESAFSRLGLGHKLAEHRIRLAWPRVVGPTLSKRSAVQRLIGKTLYVTVGSGAWATELSYHKSGILEKLDSIEKGVVEEVVFKPGRIAPEKARPTEAPPRKLDQNDTRFIEETTRLIPDPCLKEAISRAMKRYKEST